MTFKVDKRLDCTDSFCGGGIGVDVTAPPSSAHCSPKYIFILKIGSGVFVLVLTPFIP